MTLSVVSPSTHSSMEARYLPRWRWWVTYYSSNQKRLGSTDVILAASKPKHWKLRFRLFLAATARDLIICSTSICCHPQIDLSLIIVFISHPFIEFCRQSQVVGCWMNELRRRLLDSLHIVGVWMGSLLRVGWLLESLWERDSQTERLWYANVGDDGKGGMRSRPM